MEERRNRRKRDELAEGAVGTSKVPRPVKLEIKTIH